MKVLGTEIFLYNTMMEGMKAFGHKGNHRQIKIVCKCKSMTDANRKCAAAGLGDKIFKSGWYSETENVKALAAVEHSDIAFCVESTTGSNYITLEQLNNKITGGVMI